jgi:hypothetical protein
LDSLTVHNGGGRPLLSETPKYIAFVTGQIALHTVESDLSALPQESLITT